MEKQYLLFDLDGTLTDPMEGITKSVQYALRAYGIEVEDRNTLCRFIGPPLKDSFMEYYNFTEKDAQAAILKFREYFTEHGIFDNQVYPGIAEALAALKAAGKSLYVATSKPELFAKQILRHFNLDSYFEFVGGSDMEETRVKKADVIRYVLETNQITELEKVVMIGDREHDIIGAKTMGVDSVGVLYGYGSREELEAAGAGQIAETVVDLQRCLEDLHR